MLDGEAVSYLPAFLAPIVAALGLRPSPADGGGRASLLRRGLKARLEPHFEPELPLPPSSIGPEPTPEPTPNGANQTPRKPDRTPDITAADVIRLAEGCDRPLDTRLPVEVHARSLLSFIQNPNNNFALDAPRIARGRIERGLFAWEAEQAYYVMCSHHVWWRPLRWEGKRGVAEHLRRLLGKAGKTKTRKPYKYAMVDGVECRRAFLHIPKSDSGVLGPRGYKRPRKAAPKRTPKRTQRAKPKRPRLRVVETPARKEAA